MSKPLSKCFEYLTEPEKKGDLTFVREYCFLGSGLSLILEMSFDFSVQESKL